MRLNKRKHSHTFRCNASLRITVKIVRLASSDSFGHASVTSSNLESLKGCDSELLAQLLDGFFLMA